MKYIGKSIHLMFIYRQFVHSLLSEIPSKDTTLLLHIHRYIWQGIQLDVKWFLTVSMLQMKIC